MRDTLNVDKIIWLPRGMSDDGTDGHIDEVAAFVKPGVVVMSWTDDREDPQYEVLNEAYSRLIRLRDVRGRKVEVHRLHIPERLIITDEQAEWIDPASSCHALCPAEHNIRMEEPGVICVRVFFGTEIESSRIHGGLVCTSIG